jgi:hypothetical protein
VRYAICDHARLAGPRAGQHEERALGCEHSFTLALVQGIEK